MRDETVEKRGGRSCGAVYPDAGLVLWDVAYLKEGADFVLRFVIDKKGSPVGTDDCEHFERKLSDALDEDDLSRTPIFWKFLPRGWSGSFPVPSTLNSISDKKSRFSSKKRWR